MSDKSESDSVAAADAARSLEVSAEDRALHACAIAWVSETPDHIRMETVARVAAAIRAAESRGVREGLERARTALKLYTKFSLGEFDDAVRSLAAQEGREQPGPEFLEMAAAIADAVAAEQEQVWNDAGGETGTPAWIDKIPTGEWQRQCWRYAGSGGADAAEEIARRIRALAPRDAAEPPEDPSISKG